MEFELCRFDVRGWHKKRPSCLQEGCDGLRLVLTMELPGLGRGNVQRASVSFPPVLPREVRLERISLIDHTSGGLFSLRLRTFRCGQRD